MNGHKFSYYWPWLFAKPSALGGEVWWGHY